MTQEPELDEGETSYYKDDASIDPDIALSYIGDKVQSILGHFQKDFEGGVSAENLGAKYGGYGSFLPMHQRSPSIWSQPKSPQTFQYLHLPRTANPVRPEGLAPNSLTVPDASSTQRDGSYSSPSMLKLQTSKTSENASIRQNSAFSLDKVAGSFRVKVEYPSSKSGTSSDQSSLKFRLKVGPDPVARYNAEIYNLGLTSPSSSGGNSHEESDGLLLDSHETSSESPANILQIMTSFPVPSGLLSPLCEDLLNLARETEYPVKNEYEAAPRSSAISVKTLNDGVLRGKKTKYVDKSRNLEESHHEFLLDHNDFKQKILGCDNLDPFCDLNFKPLSDKVRESEKGLHIKKRKGSKDRVKKSMVSGELLKDTSLERIADQSCGESEQQESRSSSAVKVGEHRIKIHQKDVSVDHGPGNRGHFNGSCASVKAYSDNTGGEVDKGATDSLSLKIVPDATSSELNESVAAHAVNRLSFEGEKKLKGSQSGGKLVPKADSLRDGRYDAPENEHSGKKNVSRLHLSEKNVGDINLKHVENPKRILERPSGDKTKKLKVENAKAKSACADKLKERSSNAKYFNKMTLAEPPAAAIHSKEGMFGGLEQTVAPPVVIQEDWVGCDHCQKWRLLPYGTKSEQLPDKWVCSMLDWLPGMNHCDISEDETTKALQALYVVPAPENQHNCQAHADGTMNGLGSASAHHFEQDNGNFASDQLKKQKLKENQNTISMSNAVLSNGKKHLQRLALKNGSSKELKPTLTGVKAMNASNTQHPSISANVVSKLNKRKGEHVVEDNPNPRKKIKKESAQHAHGKVKLIKSNGVVTVDNLQTNGGNLGMVGHSLSSGLRNKAVVKHGKKKSAQKNAISGRVDNFQNCGKEQKDPMQDLPHSEPLHMKNSNGIQVSTKKIKLKDGQHQVETQQNNGSSLQDGKVAIKVESKAGDHRRDKKSRASQIDEKESKRSQGDDISKRKNAEARVQQLIKPKVKLRFSIDETNGVRKDSE
ncbi:hypothetical protein CDL12_09311 [Handroanthus impetiginosus]|uniref:CW-type domain-containing protein n=1 Tax=Handroanthus impetiginosus TaxID=429701 RepID=A0A2G9HKG7_9LAMI|nr:hypothetical protein CDL12_09311 [Handroanthus impetiginosus]